MKWKTAYGQEDYEVSDTGRVRRRTPHKANRWKVGRERTLQTQRSRKYQRGEGYLEVSISRKSVPVARLVAETFLGPRPPGLVINHKDGVRSNNTAANLEWVTQSENRQHAIRMGLWKPKFGEENLMSKLTKEAVREIRRTPKHTKGLAAKFGVDRSLICRIRSGKSWRHVEQ